MSWIVAQDDGGTQLATMVEGLENIQDQEPWWEDWGAHFFEVSWKRKIG